MQLPLLNNNMSSIDASLCNFKHKWVWPSSNHYHQSFQPASDLICINFQIFNQKSFIYFSQWDQPHGGTCFRMIWVYGHQSDKGPHCWGRSNKATGQISSRQISLVCYAWNVPLSPCYGAMHCKHTLRFWNTLKTKTKRFKLYFGNAGSSKKSNMAFPSKFSTWTFPPNFSTNIFHQALSLTVWV